MPFTEPLRINLVAIQTRIVWCLLIEKYHAVPEARQTAELPEYKILYGTNGIEEPPSTSISFIRLFSILSLLGFLARGMGLMARYTVCRREVPAGS